MTEKEIIEGNKLIEIFKADNSTAVANYVNDKSGEYCMNILCYHKDWSLLMPVVEKIGQWHREEMPDTDECLDSFISANLILFNLKVATTSINSVWLAVVDFIKWHNSLTSK